MHDIQSPRTDDSAIEQEIQAKGLTAPRVTPADIDAAIKSEHYFTAEDGQLGALEDLSDEAAQVAPPEPLRLLTFCVLVLRNGFTVTGESACASPENFNAEVGRKVARANAVNKVWPLLGYALKERLAAVPATFKDRVVLEHKDLTERCTKLDAFLAGEVYKTLPSAERTRLIQQRDSMREYAHSLAMRIAADFQ